VAVIAGSISTTLFVASTLLEDLEPLLGFHSDAAVTLGGR
jgi:hypothetical protein